MPFGMIVGLVVVLWWILSAKTNTTVGASGLYGPDPYEGPDVNPSTGAYTGRVSKQLTIDANVYSPTFGEPIDEQAGGGGL